MPVVSDVRDDRPKRRPSTPFIVAAVGLVLTGLVVIPLFGGVSTRLGAYAVEAKLGDAGNGYAAHPHGFGSEHGSWGDSSYWLRIGSSELKLDVTDVPAMNRYMMAAMASRPAPKATPTTPPPPARTPQSPRQRRLPRGER